MRVTSPLAAALLALASPLAAGPTYPVNSTIDAVDANPGDGFCLTAAMTCTLRAAVMEANHHAASTITVPAGMYALDLLPSCLNDSDACGDLNIDASMTIAGSPGTSIDANGLGDSIFHLSSGVTLTLSGVTLRNSTALGGAILLEANAALQMSDSRITNCKSTGYGGGGITGGNGILKLTRVTIDLCTSPSLAGGAIELINGDVTLRSCTLSGNFADYGGAIYEGGLSPYLLIIGSTLSGNNAFYGGAIYATASSFTTAQIVDSTLSGNDATSDGGGIYGANSAQIGLFNATVTNNYADSNFDGTGTGGGVFVGGSASLTMYDTLLTGNYETHFNGVIWLPNVGECAGSLLANSPSLLQTYNASHCTPSGFVSTTADPKLGPLADNGGLTLTHALLAGSPAKEAGSAICGDQQGSPLGTDQRGVKRPIGSYCDIGAFEVEPIGDVNGDGVVNVADVFYLINYLFAGGPIPLGRGNVDGDSSITVADVFYLINYLFAGGPTPI
jgi:CSLREA domain-containing protein